LRQLVIVGAGGVARELLQTLAAMQALGFPAVCAALIVEAGYAGASEIEGVPVWEGLEQLARHPDAAVVIAIGAPHVRRRIANAIADAPVAEPLVHPSAMLGRTVVLGEGTIVGPGAIATADVAVGRHVQLHAGTTIGHDTRIDDFAMLAPASTVSGNVNIGEGAFVGTGAVILPNVTVGPWSVVGAGAVVTRDVGGGVTVVGNPARPVQPSA